MRKFLFVLPALAAFSSFVSACGVHEESEIVENGLLGFGFFGGIIFTLVAVAVVLGAMVMIRRQRK